MRFRFLVTMALLLLSIQVHAINTGYVQVLELKSWSSHTGVVLATGHTCSNPNAHFRVYHDDREKLALLLSAQALGMVVNLSYTCDPGGYPLIGGVRAKSP